MTPKTLVVVVGPTAIGKTHWAIELASSFNTCVISADSRQFYKEMAIGTAVPEADELQQVPHHFIQHLSIHTPYSVGQFEKDATELLDHLFKERDIVIMAGGSGLYIDALVKGLDRFPKIKPGIREHLNQEWQQYGLDHLKSELSAADPAYYKKVDQDNPHRIIRALEVIRTTGKPFSSFLGKNSTKRSFNPIFIGFNTDRNVVYERINQRVDKMMETGLLNEAKDLYPYRKLAALQTVGYRELFRYLDGVCDLDTAIEEIKKNTRRYAKRQLTWYNQRPEIRWFKPDAPRDEVIDYIQKELPHG